MKVVNQCRKRRRQTGRGESEVDRLVRSCQTQRETGSWFHRQDEAYQKECSIIDKEDDVGRQARVTTDEEWTEISKFGEQIQSNYLC